MPGQTNGFRVKTCMDMPALCVGLKREMQGQTAPVRASSRPTDT